jgi:hypothetical protein
LVLYAYVCVFAHSHFVENPSDMILGDKPLISEVVLSHQLRLDIANDLSLAIGSTRVDWKVTLMQLGHHLKSYNLMHIHEP